MIKDKRERKTERRYHRLTYTQRLKLEYLYNRHIPVKEIAHSISTTVQTVYNEIKRGLYQTYDSEYRQVTLYSADRAQTKADYAASSGGSHLKVGNDYEFIRTIENLIVDKKYSPYAALAYVKEHDIQLRTTVCLATLYSYIDKGLFLRINNKNLWYRKDRKKRHKSIQRAKQPPRGTSIEQRPDQILQRSDFGHWEMDSVIGKSSGKGNTLLVLTERLTRWQLVLRSADKSAAGTLNALKRLQCAYSPVWDMLFKSFTMDNGSEFAGIHQNYHTTTELFYCHPSCPSERGSNENQNRIIRRFIQKGHRIEEYSDQQIAGVQQYMNEMPRKLHNGKSAEQMFIAECEKIGINIKICS